MLIDNLWLKINELLNIFFGSNFELWQRLIIIGTLTGVIVFTVRAIRG